MCHEPTRTHMRGLPDYPLPDLARLHRRQRGGGAPDQSRGALRRRRRQHQRLDASRRCRALPARDRRAARPAVRRSRSRTGVGRLVDAAAADVDATLTVAVQILAARASAFTISRGSQDRRRGGAGRDRRRRHRRPRRMRSLSTLRRDARTASPPTSSGCGPPSRRARPRRSCRTLLPAGAARNALDCALWDLEAKASGRPVWELAGLRGAGSRSSPPTRSASTRRRRWRRPPRRPPTGRC